MNWPFIVNYKKIILKDFILRFDGRKTARELIA